MKIIQSDIHSLCICPVTTMKELVLNLKSDCAQNNIHHNDFIFERT